MSEREESVTLIGQYLIGRKQDGSPYIERIEPTRDIFQPVEWAKAKREIEAKGFPFLGVVHAFSNNETGDLSAVANTDTPTPTAEEVALMNQAMLDARYLPLFLDNLEHSKVQEMLALYPLECQDCKEGRPLCLNEKLQQRIQSGSAPV